MLLILMVIFANKKKIMTNTYYESLKIIRVTEKNINVVHIGRVMVSDR